MHEISSLKVREVFVKRDCIGFIDISNMIFVFGKTKNSGIFDGIQAKDLYRF